MICHDILSASNGQNLLILGGFYPEKEADHFKDYATVLLFGPAEPNFWMKFKSTPEFNDNLPNPLDRWSKRVITELASLFSAQAFFPFGTRPHLPFYKWALKTGKIFESPTKLLVHEKLGLFVSIRGAIAFKEKFPLPKAVDSPCLNCSAPCLTSCPVEAFKNGTYGVGKCKEHLLKKDSSKCQSESCAARRNCPLSMRIGRDKAQSTFHMEAFLR